MAAVDIHWNDHQQQLIVAEFNTPWTWDDFHATVEQIHTMIASVPHPVDVIIWHKHHLPGGNPIAHFSRTTRHQPTNTGQIVIITPQSHSPVESFIKSIADVVQRASPSKAPIRTVGSIEEAYAVLARQPADSSRSRR